MSLMSTEDFCTGFPVRDGKWKVLLFPTIASPLVPCIKTRTGKAGRKTAQRQKCNQGRGVVKGKYRGRECRGNAHALVTGFGVPWGVLLLLDILESKDGSHVMLQCSHYSWPSMHGQVAYATEHCTYPVHSLIYFHLSSLTSTYPLHPTLVISPPANPVTSGAR